MKNSDSSSGSFTARLGVDLHSEMIEAARLDGTSLTTWVNDVCSRALGHLPIVPRTFADLQKLGMLNEGQASRLAHLPGGVTLVAGQVDSGKTTLLKVIVRESLDHLRNIVVIGPKASQFRFANGYVKSIDFRELCFVNPALLADDSDLIESERVAKMYADFLMRSSPDMIVMDECFGTPNVFTKLVANLVPYALTGGKLLIEIHGTSLKSVLQRLRYFDVNLSDCEVASAVILKRDASLGRVCFEAISREA
jgi:hypothetical protein